MPIPEMQVMPPKDFSAMLKDIANNSRGDRVGMHLLRGDMHDLWKYVRDHPSCLVNRQRVVL